MALSKNPGSSLIRELKRRKVVRTSIYYVIVCWIALQLGDLVFPALGLDEDKASRILLFIVILGFPVNVLIAWYFQLTPKGVVRTTSFVERRILKNMAPINDRRHSRVSDGAEEESGQKEFNWVISAETGPLTGLSFGIAKTTVLGGSADCDIAVVSPQVSGQHAQLELDGSTLTVEDLGSANGTVVNGRAIEGRHILQHEDELRLHDVIFRVTHSYSGSSKE